MRLIANIDDLAGIHKILTHLGLPTATAQLTPARAPPPTKSGSAPRTLSDPRTRNALYSAYACQNGTERFDEDDLRVLTLIAGSTAQAIELVRTQGQQLQESRLAAIGQMLSGVLHDLKTPMTVISGYAQMMADCDDGELRGQYSEQILRQFDLLAAMTREVLAFSRGESNLLIRKLHLNRFFGEIEMQLRHELSGRPIEVVLDLAYAGTAYFDEVKMRRVLHNLARNAAQAMPGGGRFTIRVEEVGDSLAMSFVDTGVGIPPELDGRLFEVFATARKEEGTGLGLAIVKRIVDEHGGTIRYTSTPGLGTTFVITLPLRRAPRECDAV